MRERLEELVVAFKGAPWWRKMLLGIAIVFVAIGVVAVALFVRRVSEPEPVDPAERVAHDRGDLIDATVERNEDRDRELADDGERLRGKREALEDEIENSGEGRDAFHDEVDRAAARGDIGAIDNARRRRRQGSADG